MHVVRAYICLYLYNILSSTPNAINDTRVHIVRLPSNTRVGKHSRAQEWFRAAHYSFGSAQLESVLSCSLQFYAIRCCVESNFCDAFDLSLHGSSHNVHVTKLCELYETYRVSSEYNSMRAQLCVYFVHIFVCILIRNTKSTLLCGRLLSE